MSRAWALAGAYAGSVIGAGFASGQELLRFFAAFGETGLWGMAVAGGLFVLFGAAVFERVHAFRTTSHQELLTRLCGEYLGSVVDMLLNLFLIGSLGVMLAAAGVLLVDQFNLPFTVGVVGTAVLTREIVRRDASRLLRLNGFLVVLLIGITLALLVPIIWGTPSPTSLPVTDLSGGMIPHNWIVGALLYSSFNVALALSPLGALGTQIESRRTAIWGAAIGGGALALTGSVIVIALLQALPTIVAHDLPILALLRMRLPRFASLYSFVLYLALLTSCIAAAYGLGYRLEQYVRGGARSVLSWLPLLGIPIAYLGFGNLVQTLYPLVGYAGLGVVVLAVFRSLRFRIN